jgi:hypothetical protein
MHRFILEPYKSGGSNRYSCPACGKKPEFTRYIDTETGQYLDDNVGKCNRQLACGYHYPPSEYFRENPGHRINDSFFQPAKRTPQSSRMKEPTGFDTVPMNVLKASLSNTRPNSLIDFLVREFGYEHVAESRKRYYIGTWKDGRTVFWQIDRFGKIRSGKLMAYDSVTGKRLRTRKPSWVHAELKGSLSSSNQTFLLSQCLFGEHLLSRSSGPVGIVESEKTAIVMSIFRPSYVWLATGGCNNLGLERLRSIARNKRQVTLFPDSSQFKKWSEIATQAQRRARLNIKVSDLLERSLSPEQKHEDIDLADIVLSAVKHDHDLDFNQKGANKRT